MLIHSFEFPLPDKLEVKKNFAISVRLDYW